MQMDFGSKMHIVLDVYLKWESADGHGVKILEAAHLWGTAANTHRLHTSASLAFVFQSCDFDSSYAISY